MPRISVIIPTCNRRDTLVDTIRTAVNQTYREIEIIVVDDGSTDDSAVEVLRRLGPDPERAESQWRQHAASSSGMCGFGFWTPELPLQYIYQSNRGMGAARNRGLQSAQGETIAFLEPDYYWDPHHLERQVEFFDQTSDVWISQGRVVVGKSPAKPPKKKPRAIPPTLRFEDVVAGTGISTSSIVIRKLCILAHGCFDENLPSCEDYDLWIRIAAHVPIYQVPESYVSVRQALPPLSWSLDRYRVYALEKAFQSGHLNSDQRHRVAEELVNRCDSLVEGYRKRNNTERSNFYDRKRKKFELEVAKLALSDRMPLSGDLRFPSVVRSEEGDLSPTGRY